MVWANCANMLANKLNGMSNCTNMLANIFNSQTLPKMLVNMLVQFDIQFNMLCQHVGQHVATVCPDVYKKNTCSYCSKSSLDKSD